MERGRRRRKEGKGDKMEQTEEGMGKVHLPRKEEFQEYKILANSSLSSISVSLSPYATDKRSPVARGGKGLLTAR
eukprot:111831-Amorphochlora_amoeboformis.AAC.2